ncbi:putative dipeptidase [Metamycoplasma subdolum]|uniref:Putative dipeptidase n=1 Tax=Metamycoplasma subdolum TaxID=92407 RepID=A0A3M0A220_9BACT|nr:Sapep family Mn(2+)-dependent dipeptidase [Metamycoplasma subdolum]RMA77489.1 putative dipeptidase [Metamycoplasma subdolum]WPB50687.1 Sapep family Mn(2+)-dependent dipeptidase [Metamycoplasma subdolum]
MRELIKYKQTENEFNEMVKNIARICAIPSISKFKKDSVTPFSKEVDMALDFALNLAKSFNFRTFKDPEGYFGFAQIGNSKKVIAIMAHLDVVPAGDESQWTSEAFKPLILEDKIFGRGTLDDKGPAIISLYAMKYIQDNDLLSDDVSIRLVFGLSEETNMYSMKMYLNKFGLPYVAYTPDGEWPLIYAEKLVYHVDLEFPRLDNLVVKAGEVVNQIPDTLYASFGEIEKVREILVNDSQLSEDKQIIQVKGKGGHGSTPEKGDNVIIKFFKAFAEAFPEWKGHSLVKFINENFQDNDFSLPKIFPEYEDFSGKLSANLGKIKTTGKHVTLSFDLRVPVTFDKTSVYADLTKYFASFNKKVEIIQIGHKPAKYLNVDSNLVNILMQTYNECLQVDEKPIAIGGGTYARLFDSCVAFGATKSMHLMHGPNEHYTFKEMQDSLEIYINALNRLQDYDKTKDLIILKNDLFNEEI